MRLVRKFSPIGRIATGRGLPRGRSMKDPGARKVFESGGSAPAYQEAPEFAKFFEADSARLIPLLQKIGKLEGG